MALFITNRLISNFTMLLTSEATARTEAEEKRRLQEQIQSLLGVVSDASDGKLDVRARVTEGALGNVADALNLMFENVGELIASAQHASDRVAQAAQQISEATLELGRGAETQTSEVAQTIEGVKLLNGQAQQVLNNCQSATAAAENARTAADQGAQAVRKIIEIMLKLRENVQVNAKKIKRLGDRSMEISGIVKAISEISAKTDMLALNASMEAARAGEQGKGFNVIAEQVRSLAERTKNLTTEIEKLVAGIQTETSEAVQQMETQTQEVESGAREVEVAGKTLDKIVHANLQSTTLVSEINEAASQQATRTRQMLDNVASINRVSESARTKVVETSAITEELRRLSVELNQELAKFEVSANGRD
jgi:twitching motility protein PilJ